MLVSLCKCWMFVSDVHPVAILSGQGKSMQFADPSRIEQSDHVQAASFAPPRNVFYIIEVL